MYENLLVNLFRMPVFKYLKHKRGIQEGCRVENGLGQSRMRAGEWME